jgi:hypothetical protein
MIFRVALAQRTALPTLPPFAGTAEFRRLFGIGGARQESLELFPQPIAVDLATVLCILPWCFFNVLQGVEQHRRVHAHDLLLGEDLPDRLQQLQIAVAVLLVDLLHRRLLDARWPFPAGHCCDAEQAAPIVARAIE